MAPTPRLLRSCGPSPLGGAWEVADGWQADGTRMQDLSTTAVSVATAIKQVSADCSVLRCLALLRYRNQRLCPGLGCRLLGIPLTCLRLWRSGARAAAGRGWGPSSCPTDER